MIERDYLLSSAGTDGACEAIIYEVSAARGITFAEMYGDGRARPIVQARWEVWCRLRKEQGLSTPQIGALFDKDHTSVMYGLRRYEERMGAGT